MRAARPPHEPLTRTAQIRPFRRRSSLPELHRLPVGVVAILAVAILLAACGGSDDASSADSAEAEQRFPDIVSVEVTRADQTFTFHVTVSSPYDTPERYADGWRIVGPDGTVFGEHTLTHDHAAEQPFTRTQSGVVIPADVDEVVVEGRDLVNGYGGGTMAVVLP